MDNPVIVGVLLAFLLLAQAGLCFEVASLFRKVAFLMSSQHDLSTALDVAESKIDEVAAAVAQLVAVTGENIMTQEQLDGFVKQAQGLRVKAESLAEAVKPLATPPPPPPAPPV